LADKASIFAMIVCDGLKNFAIPLKGGFVTTAVV
jgi:hypothetical protein